MATLNNKAFQVLKDPQQRLQYILTLKGQLITGGHYALPQSFLLEMMEINEALMELELDSDEEQVHQLKAQTAQLEEELNKELQTLTARFDDNGNEDVLIAIKDLYYRNKYLHRIKESLNRLGSN